MERGSVGEQAYAFTYDPLNRLTDASHFDKGYLSWESNNRAYQEKILEYDLNGNIKKLSRRGFDGMLMDSLLYSYTGNQLQYVHDYGDQAEGYVNTNTGTDDYSYDYNGNLDKDKNKGLINKGDIKYNYLNLTAEIIKGTESIKYVYDATGRKLAQLVYSNNGSTLVKETDYIGELVFEGNNLQFLQHSEGRAIPDGGGWEYQYHLKDHLGNVRVTFTTKPQTPVSYFANLETGTANSGENVFGNYTSTTYDLVDHTDEAGTTYQKVQWLNGGASGRVGLTKSLPVMPGDRVSVRAYAKYMNLSTNANPNAFATALASAFGVSSASTGEQLKLYNGLNTYAAEVPGGDHYGDDDLAPKAFVTIILFDRNFNYLSAGWDQITTDGEQVSGTVKEPPHDELFQEVTVHEPGYAYIFISNEHPNYVDVYFDDVTVTQTMSPIVSSSDYFPFGLSYNVGEKQGLVEQRHLYNGKELQDELAVNWYDYGARMYDSQIGRWHVTDPLSDLFNNWSPYSYAYNNPIRYVDPFGMANEDVSEEDPRHPPNSKDPGTDGPREDGFAGVTGSGSNSTNRNNNTGSGTVAGCAYCPGGFSDIVSLPGARNANGGGGTNQNNNGRDGQQAVQQGSGDPDPWKNTKAALGTAVITSAVDGPIPAGEVVGAAIIIGAFAWDLIRPTEQGNPNYPGPWTTTKPDPTIPFYGPAGNSSYEAPDPDGLPPGTGVGIGGTLGGLKLLQDYLERKAALKQVQVQQDATKYVIPRLGPR